jgi:Yip1 domain
MDRLNPWFSIWLQPQATIRQIVDTDPRRMVLWLVSIPVIVTCASIFLYPPGQTSFLIEIQPGTFPPSSIYAIAAIGIFVGPLFSIAGLYIYAWILQCTGSWLGGTADRVQLRAVIAWGYVIGIWALLLIIPDLAISWGAYLAPDTPQALIAIFSFFTGFIKFVLGMWAVVALVNFIAEVQRFSGWRAFGNYLLSILAMFIIFFIIFCIIYLVILLIALVIGIFIGISIAALT